MKRVLILYGFEYSGHHAAALALREALVTIDPEIKVDLLNYFAYSSKLLEWLSTRAFYRMVKSTPALWDSIYCNPRSEVRFSRFRKIVRGFAGRDAGDLMESFRPDAVICTQAFPCGMMSDFKGERLVDLPLYAVLTDYFVPSYWIYEGVDAYFVACEEGREELVSRGADAGTVFNEGIPVSPRFAERLSHDEAKRRFGLPPDERMILVTGGWSGWGSLERLAVEIGQIAPEHRIVVVTGRNRALYESLHERALAPLSKISVLKYVERIDILMQAADFLVGKAGGMTAAEAVAAGLPMILVDSLPGQERANADFLCRRGVACSADGMDEAMRVVERLIKNPRRRDAMRRKARGEARAGAALEIAGKVLKRVYAALPCL